MATTLGRGLRTLIFGSALAALVAGGACSPLPGNTFDPVYLKVGGTPGAAPSPASAPPRASAAPLPPGGATVWVGRYRDSRGEGAVTFSLVRTESRLTGMWKLRTGGGGPVTGVIEAGGRWRLQMENTAPECPGRFEGWVEHRETTLVGAYHGQDCDGPVTDGWLELRTK